MMHQILSLGQEVRTTTTGSICRVDKLLGGGGQGEVYQVDVDGRAMALKWYFPRYLDIDSTLRERLEKAIELGAPTDRFLWPLELAHLEDNPSFGYLMELREPRFKGIVDLMKRYIRPSFRALCKAGFELAHSYYELHARGICYRDINFENVFFDTATGEVRICDNDNVDFDRRAGGVLGTPRFMAPEVVRGDAEPSIESDLYSLAVLLFYLLFTHHPLEGEQETKIRALDLPAMRKLYGTHPIFIYDPDNDSNRPVPGFHDNAILFWQIYPSFLKERFIRAFTAGLGEPRQRIIDTKWRAHMIRLHDSIFPCQSCHADNFYDIASLENGSGGNCWKCRDPWQPPWRMRLDNETLKHLQNDIVMLPVETQLFPHHIDHEHPYDFSRPIAEVGEHPKKPGVFGLKNLSQEVWDCWNAQGEVRHVEPGRSFLLDHGSRIHFGKVAAQIRR